MIETILWFLLALAILVTFHEYGHFIVARWCGVKVLRFSVGFGNPLFTWRDRYGTDFTLAPIPLGGFVKMVDEREGDVSAQDLPYAFTQKSVWQRMAIVIAGPIANFILAACLFFVLALLGPKGIAPVISSVEENSPSFMAGFEVGDEIISVDGKAMSTWGEVFDALSQRIGDSGNIVFETIHFSGDTQHTQLPKTRVVQIDQWLRDADRPMLMEELGIVSVKPTTSWVFVKVVSGGAAESAGIKVGDELLSYDGTAVQDWSRWVEYVKASANTPINVDLLREGQVVSLVLTPKPIERDGNTIGSVGLQSEVVWPEGMIRTQQYNVLQALTYGIEQTWEKIVVVMVFLKKMIMLDISTKNLGGAFTIAEVAGNFGQAGLVYYCGVFSGFQCKFGRFQFTAHPGFRWWASRVL